MTYRWVLSFKISLIRKGTKFETDKRVEEGKGWEIVVCLICHPDEGGN